MLFPCFLKRFDFRLSFQQFNVTCLQDWWFRFAVTTYLHIVNLLAVKGVDSQLNILPEEGTLLNCAPALEAYANMPKNNMGRSAKHLHDLKTEIMTTLCKKKKKKKKIDMRSLKTVISMGI